MISKCGILNLIHSDAQQQCWRRPTHSILYLGRFEIRRDVRDYIRRLDPRASAGSLHHVFLQPLRRLLKLPQMLVRSIALLLS